MRPVACLPLLMLLAACRPPASGPVTLDRGAEFLLRPASEGPRTFQTVEVRVEMPGHEETLLTTVENTGQDLRMAASTPLGMTLFTLRLEGDRATVTSSLPLPRRLDPRLLPALVQFATWPSASLQAGVVPPLTFEESGPERRLVRKGKLLWRCTRQPDGSQVIEHPGLGLKAHIRPLED